MNDTAYEWDPISNLDGAFNDLRRSDLHLVHQQWVEEKRILRDPDKIERLESRLGTEWAIETGIIERLYTLERGVTETLIELGLESLHQYHERAKVPQSVARLISDQRDALEFVFQFVKQDRELTLAYVKELHQLLTRHQDTSEAVDQFGNKMDVALLKGTWKILPNNPILSDGRMHEYCPPEFVQDEMEQLIRLHDEHTRLGVPSEVEAAWLHHRFTQIHPFQDGNGRIARALATMVFLRGDYLPLVVRDEQHKDKYLSALERADEGDLAPLVTLFADIEIEDLSRAIQTIRELRGEGVTRIAASAAERVRMRQEATEEEVHQLTEEFVGASVTRLEEITGELALSFKNEGVEIQADVRRSEDATMTWWNYQIVETARHLGYWADLAKYRNWVQLRLRLPQVPRAQTNIIISFHHKGSTPGLMVASCFITTSSVLIAETSEGHDSFERFETIPVLNSAFTYSAGHRNPTNEFKTWLDEAIEAALDKWQSRI